MSANETSNGFRDEFFFLSNFYEAPTKMQLAGVDGLFKTGEHLFQAQKTLFMRPEENKTEWVNRFIAAPTPAKAKYVGRSIRINVPSWDEYSTVAMKKTIYAKFSQYPDLKQKLLATGDLLLVEYNSWGDTVWGVNESTRKGENRLGSLLMNLRTYYQNNL